MLKFVVFTTLAALVLADQDQEHSNEGDIDVRVVGGDEAKPHTWPWQISFQVEIKNKYSHTCGGTLIRPGWVMTAAHCIEDGATYRVAVGKHNINKEESTEQYLNVNHIYVHPQWNADRLTDGYDIALLELSTPASLNENVKVAALPSSGQILPNTTQCFTTGWGYTRAFGLVKDVLQEAQLPLVDYSTCSSKRWWYRSAKESMICAGGDGTRSSCQGDSGGPLNCKVDDEWVVHGVTSFGPVICNYKNRPSVFTRVSAYIDWINSIIHR